MRENTKLEGIKKLHKLDRKLIVLRKKHDELPNTLKQLDEAVEGKDKALQEAGGRLTALRTRYDASNLELKTHESEIERLESQLSSVKTNKEYSAILSETATEKADIAKIEDEMLLLIDNIEQQEKTIQECSENKRLAERDRENHKDEIAQEQQEVSRSLREFGSQRDTIAAIIAPEVRHQYERILKKRGASTVVPVIDNSCQGCFMKMTPQVQAQLLKNESIIYCKFCSRIIYLD
jgi:predicted  nucleic acid-binding Zn-ribbon protein